LPLLWELGGGQPLTLHTAIWQNSVF